MPIVACLPFLLVVLRGETRIYTYSNRVGICDSWILDTDTSHNILHIFMAEKNTKALCVQIVVELAFHGFGFFPTLRDKDEDEILSPPS